VLFATGSYNVTPRAREILGKVATVINGKPEFEAMVESHTDNVPYTGSVLQDNWDLSVKRATSIVRVLQDLGVKPEQLIAAGRGEYLPLVDNDTPENRSRNRRTKILILPKIDQFYKMIEDEMKNMSEGQPEMIPAENQEQTPVEIKENTPEQKQENTPEEKKDNTPKG
jgi:chemotaxis protein MotB